MSTNDNIPEYNIKGWLLFDTSPIELSAAQSLRRELVKSGRYFAAKTAHTFYEDGKEYAYVRVKK